MIDWQRFIPVYWVQNEPTCRQWDKALNDALDTHGVSHVGYYTCTIGHLTVWVGNWPYAYGTAYMNRASCPLPTVATRKRLRRAVGEVAWRPAT